MTTFGGVPVQVKQNRSTSTFVAWPVMLGVNVWPNQDTLLKAAPLVDTFVFCWSMAGKSNRMTLPGLAVRLVLVGMPAWKSACVVSVRHALAAAVPSEKFCVVVPPSAMTMLLAVAVDRKSTRLNSSHANISYAVFCLKKKI